MDALDPEVAALVEELNAVGEDTDAAIDRQHVPASGVLAGLPGAGAEPCWRRCSGKGAADAIATLSTSRALGHAHGAFSRRN